MSSIEDKLGGQGTSRAAVAAVSFLAYDVLINMEDEVELIWRGPNRWSKWTYLLVRHVPYLALLSITSRFIQDQIVWTPTQCRIWLIYQNVIIEGLVLTVELILVMRGVYAMYDRNRHLLVVLMTLLLAEIGSMSGMLYLTIPAFHLSTGCAVISTPKLFPFYWILPLVFETTLFALTLIKFAMSVSRRTLINGPKHSVLYILVRDGTWAYAIIFVIMLMNTIFYSVEKNPLAGVCFAWEIAVLSFAGSHILLNTRQLIIHPNGTSFWADDTRVASAMRFQDAEVVNLTEISIPSNIETLPICNTK